MNINMPSSSTWEFPSASEEETISIFYRDKFIAMIPYVDLVQELFRRWSRLSPILQQEVIDNFMSKNENCRYTTEPGIDRSLRLCYYLLLSLNVWSFVQDHQGACGIEPTLFVLTSHLETELYKIVHLVQETITELQKPLHLRRWGKNGCQWNNRAINKNNGPQCNAFGDSPPKPRGKFSLPKLYQDNCFRQPCTESGLKVPVNFALFDEDEINKPIRNIRNNSITRDEDEGGITDVTLANPLNETITAQSNVTISNSSSNSGSGNRSDDESSPENSETGENDDNEKRLKWFQVSPCSR